MQRRSLKKSFNKKTWINLRYLTRYRIDISTILNYNSRPNREPQARIFRRKKIIINYLSKNEVSLLPSREEFIPLLPEQPLLEGGAPLHRPLHPLHLLLLHAHRAFVSNLNQNIINNDICLPFYVYSIYCNIRIQMTCIHICIFAFSAYNFKQVNVSGIQIFRAQLLALNLRKVMLNAANIYLFRFILTKCKYLYRAFIQEHHE